MKNVQKQGNRKSVITKSTKTSRSANPKKRLAVSWAAYNYFLRRFFETLGRSANPEKSYCEAEHIFESYLEGNNIDDELKAATMETRIAFLMVKPEIDKAMQRSLSGRRRAELRKAKREEQAEKSDSSDKSGRSDESYESDLSDKSDYSNRSDYPASHNLAIDTPIKIAHANPSDQSDQSDLSDRSDLSDSSTQSHSSNMSNPPTSHRSKRNKRYRYFTPKLR